jgi:type VI secretion system protein ImpA
MPSAEEAQGDEKKGERREAMLRDGKISPEAFAEGVDETPKKFYKDLNAELDAALAAIQRLDTVTKQRFDKGDVPSYRELRLAVENVRVLAKELLAKKLIAEPDPVSATGEAAKDGEHPAADVSSSGPVATVADAERRVIAAAEYLRKANPASPVSYLLLRGLRWGELRSHGGEAAEKLLAAPAPEARSRLRAHFVDERWDVLLDSAEQVMATPAGRGWLDLQFYAIRACEHLGEPRDDARRAILDALRSLLVDIPSLPNATLMDAMPTASPETKGWIDKDVLSKSGADDGAADDSRAARSPRDPFTVAQAEATSGHPERAIQLLARELAREGSERAQFLRRTQIATIMVENGLIAVAKPLLAQLIEQIEQSSVTLADWEEGSTLAQPFALMVKCLDAQPGDGAEKREEYYQRVCTLDPVQALRLTGR